MVHLQDRARLQGNLWPQPTLSMVKDTPMQLAHTPITDRVRQSRRRGGHSRVTHARAASATDLARRGGGPQDQALYTCSCGCAFTAAVSTSVGCPHCGTAQAW